MDQFLLDFENEYETMVATFEGEEKDSVRDVMREWNKGESPITFGDFGVDKKGIEYPLETAMVKKDDYCTKQSLDYIF
jgi:hypothetical protein